MKILYVGDCHAKPDSINEMELLLELIENTAVEEEPDAIVFLGDQFHTHSVLHLSVIAFWKRAFNRLETLSTVYALVGNHDISGKTGDTNHSMMLFEGIIVVDRPVVSKGVLFCPFYMNGTDLIKVANEHPSDILVCHQTFDGAQYDNGFYAKDGIDSNLLPQKQVISGHIHTPSRFGKVWYPGSPRWQSISDANINRAIWVVDHTTGEYKSFDTSTACIPIYAFVDREDLPLEYGFKTLAAVLVDVYGTPAYCSKRATEFESKGARVRQFPIANKEIRVKESDGLADSFKQFISNHTTKNGTPPARLMELAEQRITWLKR